MAHIQLTDELRAALGHDENPDTCHVVYFQDGQLMQCPNEPAWCLIRASDGVHRPVCDAHKREIYDAHSQQSVLIPRCEACRGV